MKVRNMAFIGLIVILCAFLVGCPKLYNYGNYDDNEMHCTLYDPAKPFTIINNSSDLLFVSTEGVEPKDFAYYLTDNCRILSQNDSWTVKVYDSMDMPLVFRGTLKAGKTFDSMDKEDYSYVMLYQIPLKYLTEQSVQFNGYKYYSPKDLSSIQ